MTSAESAYLPAPQPAAGGDRAVAIPGAPRRRLFRKYALLFIALVGATLLINSGFDFWFSYQENKAALVRVQQEKAQAAAARIEEFVDEIERQIGWTTHAQWASGPLEQRLQDFSRLLRQVYAITELSELDGQGREQLKVSRLSMNVVGGGQDLSQTASFTQAKAQRLWFSPVYFRKQSEPYLSLAIRRDGRNAGVTIAEINLKLIWDVVTQLKIGQGGYAYVVDRGGKLIAHPDISLVLRDTDLSKLPQVAAALGPQDALSPNPRPLAGEGRVGASAGDSATETPAVRVAQNLAGRSVLTAHAAIAPLGWQVFVEVPLAEAFAPLYGAAMRTLALLALGLVAATFVALVLARRMTGPIRELQEGAARIGAGELDRRIEIHTGDELETLAGQFNRMGADLQRSYAELEQRVRDRTAELSEALDQQTATAEVLGVINASPGDLAPVFDAILEKAHSLCGAEFGVLFTFDGECFWPAAAHGASVRFREATRQGFRPGPGNPFVQVLAGEPFVQIPDLADLAAQGIDDPELRIAVEIGIRTFLIVALRKDDKLLGVITANRSEARPFTDKQIALLQNFAAQAVVAMENARLITETREALDQQTATAEVLGVINSSPGDLAPVFDAMLERALHLCGAPFGILHTYDGESFAVPAWRGASQEFIDFLNAHPGPPSPHTGLGRVVAGERVVQIADIAADEAYRAGDPLRVATVELLRARTCVWVGLFKDDVLLGVLTIYRQEVRPFSDKQIALLRNFAAQAVIAMENARLITETREALEQQTATAEVLQVINSSPGDLAPVFDAVLDKAMRLCEASFGYLGIYDGERFRTMATLGLPPDFAEYRKINPQPGPGSTMARVLAGERVISVADLMADEVYRAGEPARRALVDLGGARSGLTVALAKENAVLGALMIYRQEMRPFIAKQIALVQKF
ncbi:MAG TPA: GAF domain-containing protein, partial [Stellaceae bacterium]|nr:GAF domain-containing protein [Stellaceae bacterium]